MRKELNIFVDPKTKKRLTLRIAKEYKGDIISGALYNENKVYPIIRGIPRFVGTSLYLDTSNNPAVKQTAASFGKKWNEQRFGTLGSTRQDKKNLKEQFMALLGCASEHELRHLFRHAKKTLNAGCGVAWSEYLFNYSTKVERHCLDLSLSVEVAYKKTRDFKNVIVSQASVFEMPYPKDIFDIVYSDGVIHHTPNPKKALKALIEKTVPGGLIGIYIYAKKPFLREIADREIRRITTSMGYDTCMEFSKRMSDFGRALQNITQPLIIKDDIKLLNIKKGKYNLHTFIYDYFIKCWFHQKQDRGFADLVNQDWYHPYYASHHTKEEILSWFEEGGVEKVTCIQPKGWENSGYFMSGTKR